MGHWSTGIETRNIIGCSGTRLLFIPRGDAIEWLNFKTATSRYGVISRAEFRAIIENFSVTEHVRDGTRWIYTSTVMEFPP